MSNKNIVSTLFLLLTVSFLNAQTLTQTVRGTVVDSDAKTIIFGATVVIQTPDTLFGTVTDIDGKFKIADVPVGRVNIRITSIGYQEIALPNTLLVSGKEKVLEVEMTDDITNLKEVVVTANENKAETQNKMAVVSAKKFTVEETNRYAGSFNDPARMVSAFAGVSGNAEGDNDIVVRGNSPRGILWRLDGIDIPNPNHFSGEGSTGGPVNSLNGAMLANSDFFSGAFAPEYGDALSGVFDVRFRKGNSEKREYSFSAGMLGLDGTLEGPFSKNYQGSYLVNYRYSSLALMDKLGILDFDGIPKYQDASFNLNFPTKKAGTFSLIGLGGISSIIQSDKDDETDTVYEVVDFGANLGVLGLKHVHIANSKVYVKSYIAATNSGNGWEEETLDSLGKDMFLDSKGSFENNKLMAQTIINYKASKKNSFQLGVTGKLLYYSFSIDEDVNETTERISRVDAKGNSALTQSFLSWKHRITNELTFITGLHHTHFFLNDNYALEPRLGLKWQVAPRHNFSLGYGLHSRLEPVSTYMYNPIQANGAYESVNEDLEFSKSIHYVVGYGFQMSKNLHLKTEIYYQQLHNIPVSIDSANVLSLINSDDGIPNTKLINEGEGENYGIELTLERFFHNDFYYLVTGSLYKSTFSALNGVEYNTKYDATYASNLLLGKEFKFGKKKNKTWGINIKGAVLGGGRYSSIDLEASRLAGETVRQAGAPFDKKGDDVFLLNLGLTFRKDKKRTSQSFKLDFQNLTNNKAAVSDYYNSRTGEIEQSTQLPFIPNIIYTIKF